MAPLRDDWYKANVQTSDGFVVTASSSVTFSGSN